MGNSESHPTTESPVSVDDIMNTKIIPAEQLDEDVFNVEENDESDEILDEMNYDNTSDDDEDLESLSDLLSNTHPYNLTETNIFGIYVNEVLIGTTISEEQSNNVCNIVADQVLKYVKRYTHYTSAFDAENKCWIITFKMNGLIFSNYYKFVVWYKQLSVFNSDEEAKNEIFKMITSN